MLSTIAQWLSWIGLLQVSYKEKLALDLVIVPFSWRTCASLQANEKQEIVAYEIFYTFLINKKQRKP